jgi:hypothetical protein
MLKPEWIEAGKNWNWARANEKALAWRNTMVSAINAGLEQGMFILESEEETREPPTTHRCTIARLPSVVFIQGIGWEELSVHVGVNVLRPDPRIEGWAASNHNQWRGVEAFAAGWLERKNGKHLQVLSPMFYCSRG